MSERCETCIAVLDGDSDGIIKNYFNYKINSATKMRTRILLNIVIKMLYVAVNVVAFLLTDSVLVNRYRVYGLEWVKWAKLENNMAYDYMGKFWTLNLVVNAVNIEKCVSINS